jgi:hypothetical protein
MAQIPTFESQNMLSQYIDPNIQSAVVIVPSIQIFSKNVPLYIQDN